MTVWRMSRGANIDGGGATFRVWAPAVRSLTLHIADGLAAGDWPMEPQPDTPGTWHATVRGVTAGNTYGFLPDDGGAALADPASRWQPRGVHGLSAVVDPDGYQWTDAEWKGRPPEELVFYELHVGTFTPAGTFHGVIERLPILRELGITAIELMPVAEFPGSRNWGYDGVHPFAPQSTYGGPDALRRLVDAAHAHGIAVFLDVVYNHFGPEGAVIARYAPVFTDRYHTPWGDGIDFDGPTAAGVRRYFIDNALYWVTEYHIDGLRLDAVHAIQDASQRHILDELATAVHEQTAALGRRIHVVAESDLNDPALVRAREAGGYGLDAQWNDDFHHAVHVRLTGETSGYYVDYDDPDAIVRVLRSRFALDGRWSEHRQRRHGQPAADLPPHRFIVFAQNHDQIGNRAHGDRLTTLIDFDRVKLAAMFTLHSPFLPLLFMGEEYGETRPFLYFVSHGESALIEAVRKGRRDEFRSFGWAEEVPDPQAEETFEASRLSWNTSSPQAAALLALYRDLIALRRREPALHDPAATLNVREAADHIIVEREVPSAGHLLAVYGFGEEPARLEAPLGGEWRRVLSTTDPLYGGAGGAPEHLHDREPHTFPPWSGSLYRRLAA